MTHLSFTGEFGPLGIGRTSCDGPNDTVLEGGLIPFSLSFASSV